MPQHIIILGAGEMGHAIKKLLVEKDVVVTFVDTNKDKTLASPDQSQPADYVFACVPSRSLRAGLQSVKPLSKNETVIVLLTKGIEPDTQRLNFEIAQDFYSPERVAILAGPMLAHEIMRDQLSVGVLAASDEKNIQALTALFLPKVVKFQYESDMKSVALASVLKNIYALAVGVADGLGWGLNAKGALLAQAVSECREIMNRLGSNKDIILTSSGLGDLIATSMSPYSNNRQMGEHIVKGELFKESEGVVSLPSILEMLGSQTENLPILAALKSILIGGESPREIFEQLFLNL